MFLNRNKKNNVYPCKAQFYFMNVGFKGVKLIKVCFRDEMWRYPGKVITMEYIAKTLLCYRGEAQFL